MTRLHTPDWLNGRTAAYVDLRTEPAREAGTRPGGGPQARKIGSTVHTGTELIAKGRANGRPIHDYTTPRPSTAVLGAGYAPGVDETAYRGRYGTAPAGDRLWGFLRTDKTTAGIHWLPGDYAAAAERATRFGGTWQLVPARVARKAAA